MSPFWKAMSVVLVTLAVRPIGCRGQDPPPKEMIVRLRTGEVVYTDIVRWLRALSAIEGDPEVEDFLVSLAENPYICFGPVDRELAENPANVQYLPVNPATLFRVMAIEALPERPDPRVLRVLVDSLSLRQRGRYPVRKGWFVVTRVTASTEQVRHYAREKLEAITGEDHGYDREKWREAILKRYGNVLHVNKSNVADAVD